jgi:protein-L-isoaspartate O-methyltransferase
MCYPRGMSAPVLTYAVDSSRLGPDLGARFLPLAEDAALHAWLENVGAHPHGVCTTKLVGFLAHFRPIYEVHALLSAYAMHLVSEAQLRQLLGAAPLGSLLDVGAGAGYVTAQAAPLFQEVVCTETSPGLRKRLVARGYATSDLDLSLGSLGRRFDVITCFNVLDRTPRPLGLLRGMLQHLADDGRLLLSVPLPVSAHVHVAGGTISAQERLPTTARTFESAAVELTEHLLRPAGFRVQSFSRVPYLSQGDRGAKYYVLDAGLWLLRRNPPDSR